MEQSINLRDDLLRLLDGSADGFCALDRDGRIIYVNRAAQRILGGATDLIGRLALDVLGEQAHLLRRAIDDRNAAIDFRMRAPTATGERWFDVRACPSSEGGVTIHFRHAATSSRADADGTLNDASADVLAAIGEAAPDFVWVTNASGDLLYVNRRWIEYTGLNSAQTDRRGYMRTIHPSDLPRFLNKVEYAQQQGTEIEGEFRYRRHDGVYRWFWVRSTPIKDEAGRVMRRVGVAVDVTDRIEAVRALRDSEARYRSIFDSAAVGMAESTVEGRLTAVNQRLCDMLGYTREELLALTPLDITHEDDVARTREMIRALVAGERSSHTTEKRYVRKDGETVWAHASISSVRDESGCIVRLIAAVLDVTAHKRLEAARERSEALTQHIVEHSPIGILVADTAGRFMHVNNAWLSMLGYTMEDVRQGRVNWKEMTVPEHRHLDEKAIADVRAHGKHAPFEKTLIRKDGSHLPALAATAYLGGPGEVGVGFLVDLSEVRSAYEAVLKAKAEAEHANKAKDQFLAVLSHELRTPLTPVVMTVAAMEMDRTLSPQMREDLAMIRRNIELETKLIDDLLDVTRIANGKLRLQPRATDVHTLMRNVLEMLRPEVKEKRIELAVELSASDPSVFGDPARLQQVFWNLIKNAVKFAPDQQGRVAVRTWNPTERVVCTEVSDNGAGIEPTVLPRIFNAFDQGEQTITRQFGGLGLGLAISKALADLHGGTIRAESEGKGRGARFTLELPTRNPVERIVDQIQPFGAAHNPANARPRILLVEDHLDTQRTLGRLLEHRGYEVLLAASVTAAVALLASATSRIDLVVSDIGLPDATGYDLMRQLRAGGSTIPAVAVSGFGMDGDLRTSQEAGFAAHFTKPVDLQQLDATIRSLLSQVAVPGS